MIIGISGKIGSGKDLTGCIIQALTNKPTTFDGMEEITEAEIRYKVWDNPKFETKKFADTLKDFVCMLIGCTREGLEDRDFKETPLGEEWWLYTDGISSVPYIGGDTKMLDSYNIKVQKTTPRLLLQLMGTECGREILHPNIWVNAVMAHYRALNPEAGISMGNTIDYSKCDYPNWVITDMRFPNELEAVQKRGITIRIERPGPELLGVEFLKKDGSKETVKAVPHPSETALDNAEFDYTIVNDGTIKDLVMKVKEILIKEKII